ncbi:hypothetical protein BDV98DRAFT_393328 [Pterulicium gracile]|uniref:Uncharacterized protein n=1 Tax=Pterulicium gracile TaxID=1884261 RepID=A0A5C3QTN7_9AGAR|nr:hypothetical protein BDV98DRAFT_393328 [Pterula gracilis]
MEGIAAVLLTIHLKFINPARSGPTIADIIALHNNEDTMSLPRRCRRAVVQYQHPITAVNVGAVLGWERSLELELFKVRAYCGRRPPACTYSMHVYHPTSPSKGRQMCAIFHPPCTSRLRHISLAPDGVQGTSQRSESRRGKVACLCTSTFTA